MFDDEILPAGRTHEQLMNLDLKRAYEVMAEVAKARTTTTLPLLMSLSALVMRNTGSLYNTVNGMYDESKGELRLQNVSAGRGGRSYLAWEKVEARTTEFVKWLNDRLSTVSSLSAAAVYDLSFETHLRLVTIHPWPDGNGRMARLLMNLVQLEGGVVPLVVRSSDKANYIQSLSASQEEGSSVPFLSFMAEETLAFLAEEIEEYKEALRKDVPWDNDVAHVPIAEAAPQVTPQVRALILALDTTEQSAAELRQALGLSDAKSFRRRYLRPALDAGFIEMTVPDKPHSRFQRYRLTEQGEALLRSFA